MDVRKIIAACCCGTALLLMLILSLMDISAAGTSLTWSLTGADLLSRGAAGILIPLLLLAGMAVSALLLDGKISAGICFGGTLVPVITWAVMKNVAVSAVSEDMALARAGSYLIRITMGAGTILAVLLVLAAAILCLLSGLGRKARPTTAGLSSGNEEEW